MIYLFTLIALLFPGIKDAGNFQHSRLQSVEVNELQINDSFWNQRIETIQKKTLPLLFDLAEKQGKLDNFRIIAGRAKGKIAILSASDSDVYKLLEAAGYSMLYREDESLRRRCDSIIDDIVAAQDASGYLHSLYMLELDDPASPPKDSRAVKRYGYGPAYRWGASKDKWPFAFSQLYCAGHMMEAGVAYYLGTGDRKFMEAGMRFADLICKVFDKEKALDYADHPQVEIGLMKLYEMTGKEAYLKTADIISRYSHFSRPVDIHFDESSKPLHEQCHAFGHCVRTAYVYTGATEVVRAAGYADLQQALMKIWKNVVGTKMYIHGGTGNGTGFEQHGESYAMPIRPTYSECCSCIGQSQWNHSLNLLTGNARFASVVESIIYNAALAGISQDGTKFFYSNKLVSDSLHMTNRWSGLRETYLYCCPSKLPGFITGIGRWIYAKDQKGLYVNQFIGSSLKTEIGGQKIALTQEADYIFNGKTKLILESDGEFAIHVRLPQWLHKRYLDDSSLYFFEDGKEQDYKIRVNGKLQKIEADENGYLSLQKSWRKGDEISINFDNGIRVVASDPIVKDNKGLVALSKGPLLYCMESVDNDFNIHDVSLLTGEKYKTENYGEWGTGALSITGKAVSEGQKVVFKAIPYFMWQNRGTYSMSLFFKKD